MSSKISEEIIESICLEIKRGVPFKYAAESVGITYATFNKWVKKGELEPENSDSLYRMAYDEFNRAKALAIVLRVETLRKASEAGDWRSSAWWLERVAPEEFGKKSVVDASVNANVNQLNLADLFSDDELNKIIEEEKKD